ncbi:MAG: PP2C family protein-serine/threonine phosphatase [Acidobacteria bacterium]|nr:PP2C family protein-serine/threonine phosphatase [Acidobacteriota bacterium]MBV9623315.1 PP2C family protein-serine/threonine phosphatase [Acidobacteriota bacterium]
METAVRIARRYREEKSARSSVAGLGQAAGQAHNRALRDQLASLRYEHDGLSRALYEAAQVQRRLCGPRQWRAGSYEFAGEIFPVRHLSGDFITVLELEGDLVFAIGDIAGKGLMAGMWFTYVVGMIRRHIAALGDPAAALSAVEHDLLLSGLEIPLTTLFLARLNLRSGELTYSNAGHPPALVIRENQEVQELSAGGPLLGLISNASFENGRASLCPGDMLLAYSDGVAECRNESGTEFGTPGLLNAARKFSGSDAGAMLFTVLAAVENFMGKQYRDDDMALFVLRRFSAQID